MAESTRSRIYGDDARRFRSKVDAESVDDCWTWRKPSGNGYGYFYLRGDWVLAHRLSYVIFKGPIPEGLVIDHLCRNTACINPRHLDAVTQQENVLRGESPIQMRARHAARTHCCHGHEFTPHNTRITTKGARACRTCDRMWWQLSNEKRRKIR